MRAIAALALVGLLGCQTDSPADRARSVSNPPEGDSATETETGNTSLDLPEGVELTDGYQFRLDTVTEVVTMPFTDYPGAEIRGVLTDSDGRREIQFVHPNGTVEVLAASGFHMPPTGTRATDGSGAFAICHNTLTGGTSDLTEGVMPDPRQGMELNCRINGGDGFGEPFEMSEEGFANWVVSLAMGSAADLTVTYYRDNGLLIPDENPDFGTYQRDVSSGVVGDAVLIAAGFDNYDETEPLPDD